MSSLKNIQAYTPPVLREGKEWYIEFYAFNPVKAKLCRKKIKINSVKKISERRKYAKDFINRINAKLALGWNPWIEQENGYSYTLFSDVIEKYISYIDKQHVEDNYREDTHKSYRSYINNILAYNKSRINPITYIYQMDKDFCVGMLDEVYLGRDNTAFTHDNYLTFLRTFGKFCTSRGYLKTNPTEGINVIGKKGKKKLRTTIPNEELERIYTFLHGYNKHYLLAAYILFYCFIRPKEMTKLRLYNINLKKQTIYLPDTITKNRNDGTITLPAKVIHLMVELNIFSQPNDSFLFSDQFQPGPKQKSEKMFRDFWTYHVRKKLNLPDKYKFYSLKDTGITNMLRHYDVLSVRDQARHSSILMTDIYTPHDIQEANDLIKNYEGEF